MVSLREILDYKQMRRIGLPRRVINRSVPKRWEEANIVYMEDQILLELENSKMQLGAFTEEGEVVYMIITSFFDEDLTPTTEDKLVYINRVYYNIDDEIVIIDG